MRPSRRPRHRATVALALLVGLLAAACGSSAASAPPALTPPVVTASPALATLTPAPTAPTAPGALDLDVGSIVDRPVPTPPPGTTWATIADEAAPFTFEAPGAWAEHQHYPWKDGDEVVGTLVAAGPAVSKIGTDFSVPGVVVGLSAVATGTTPRAMVEGEDYASACTGRPIEEAAEAAYTAAFRIWSSCGDNPDGLLLVIAIAPLPGPGLIVAILQGASGVDLAYLEHILASIRPAEVAVETLPPEATPVSGQAFTVTVDECLLQMGDVFAIGIIRNDDSRSHSYLLTLRFKDDAGIVIGEQERDTPALGPGEAYRYQTPHLLAQGVRAATCSVVNVEVFG